MKRKQAGCLRRASLLLQREGRLSRKHPHPTTLTLSLSLSLSLTVPAEWTCAMNSSTTPSPTTPDGGVAVGYVLIPLLLVTVIGIAAAAVSCHQGCLVYDGIYRKGGEEHMLSLKTTWCMYKRTPWQSSSFVICFRSCTYAGSAGKIHPWLSWSSSSKWMIPVPPTIDLEQQNRQKTTTTQSALFYLACVRMGEKQDFGLGGWITSLCGITTGLISRSEQSKGWAFLIPGTSILTAQSQLTFVERNPVLIVSLWKFFQLCLFSASQDWQTPASAVASLHIWSCGGAQWSGARDIMEKGGHKGMTHYWPFKCRSFCNYWSRVFLKEKKTNKTKNEFLFWRGEVYVISTRSIFFSEGHSAVAVVLRLYFLILLLYMFGLSLW